MNRKKSTILVLCSILLGHLTLAQNDTNLVINPSFEDHNACPELMLTGTKIKLTELNNWDVANKGTVDFFQQCSEFDQCGVPENMWGYQTAHTGNAYVGLLATGGGLGSKKNREYIQGQLKDTLTGGREYYVEFHISMGETSNYTVNTMGLYASQTRIQGHNLKILGYDSPKKSNRRNKVRNALSSVDNANQRDTFCRMEDLVMEPITPQVKMKEFVGDTMNWVKISGTFIAEGGEKYITIGSFEKTIKRKGKGRNREKIKLRGAFVTKKQSRNLFIGRLSKSSYYYIDDVLLRPVYPTVDTVPTINIASNDSVSNMETQLLYDGHYTLKKLHFDTDEYSIDANSFSDLDSLVAFLQKYKELKVEISGHTDNMGDDNHNLELSANRAKAVVRYLKNKGIDPGRLQARGYGHKIPIVPNDTDARRKLNRRVEIVLIE